MNRLTYLSAVAALSGAMLASCGGSGKADGFTTNVELEGYEYNVVASLPDSLSMPAEGGKYMQMSGYGMLPVSIGGRDVELLRDSLRSLAGIYITDRGSTLPKPDDGMTLTDLTPDSTDCCSMAVNQLTVALASPKLVVWKNYSYQYLCQAAHGVYNTTFVNYSIEMGKILSLDDIFAGNYKERLLALIREKLVENKVDLTVGIDEVGIPDDFEVTESGISFVYPLYEIAPYVAGEVTVSLESYELSELFAPEMQKTLWGLAAL